MEDNLDLPPGFRFHPTDEEIITFYLIEKFRSQNFNPIAIGEANLNSCEPWDLPSQAKMGEKEWYFFCKRFKRYPTGSRTNRATKSGYWKATGKDKEIFHKGKPSSLAGMKKTLVFYLGRAPRGKKTNWVMHEYRLEGKFSGNHPPNISNDEWVVCRVFDKGTNPKTKASPEQETIDSFGDFVSSPDDRFAYNDDRGFARASPAAMINHPYQTSPMATEYPKFPQRSYFSGNDGQLWSGFPSQEFLSSSDNADYMQDFGNFGLPFEGRGNAIMNQAKAEQHSNQSFLSASQDTGLSTDMNTEISSVVSKSDVGIPGSYEDAGYPSFSANPEDGFVSFWQR